MHSSLPPPSPEPEVSPPCPAEVAPVPRWRVAVLRSIAAAHLVAGILECLKVALNFLWRLPYTGGPLALPGVVTAELSRFLYSLALVSSSDQRTFDFKSRWIIDRAQSTGHFLGIMMAAHIALGALNVALGYGLWLRRRWARWLDVAVLGLAGLMTMAHGAALVRVGGNWREFGIVALVVPLVFALPAVAFLVSPRTGVLFADRGEGVATRRRRPWWMLSLQCAAALVVVALAGGWLALFGLGPMAEVVWIAAEMSGAGR